MKKSREKTTPDLSSLLVFGYACKIFRDDGKAQSLEAGDHLIPWMGDNSIKIDRYDGRGHLYSLGQYESKPGASDEFGELEKHEEELCEEERWRSLHSDDVEEKIKEEEELKRLSNSAQFQFNYEDSTESSGTTFGPENTTNPEDIDDDEPYHASDDLCLPSDIATPPTEKLFNVIEKTALLISKQGPQMEILLKAKQAGNPVFDFLSLEHPLHKFYKHLLMMVKTKQYKKKEAPPPAVSLVPQYSDMAHMTPDLAPKIISIPYKRSEDCSYSQLISKLQKFAPNPAPPPPPAVALKPPSPVQASAPPPPPSAELPPGPIVIPPPDLQTIVDKMASYVARNGRSFEEVVRTKDEERFSFLCNEDKHHNYYLHKLAIYTTGNYDPSVATEPLTFKLKKPDSAKETSIGPNNAISGLEYGSDSDDDEVNKKEKAIEKSDTNEKDSEAKKSGFPSLVGFLPPAIAAQPKLYQEEEDDKEKKKREEEAKKRQEETNKLRDKLAAKAREKMVLAAKEKALQLERKRKAAHFLAQLAEKKTSVSSVTAVDGGSSAEEGEVVDILPGPGTVSDNHELPGVSDELGETVATIASETVTAVSIWPPPAPPKLVIPKLAGQESPVELSSDSEEEKRRRKKRRRSRSRSRTRDRHRKRDRSRHKIKRSRSKHKKTKKHKTERRKLHTDNSDKDSKAHRRRNRSHSSDRNRRRKRSRKYTSEDIDSDGSDRRRSMSRDEETVMTKDMETTRENSPNTSVVVCEGSREGSQEISVIKERHNPIIEGIVQPKVNKMTEELRAKVRAMLESKK